MIRPCCRGFCAKLNAPPFANLTKRAREAVAVSKSVNLCAGTGRMRQWNAGDPTDIEGLADDFREDRATGHGVDCQLAYRNDE